MPNAPQVSPVPRSVAAQPLVWSANHDILQRIRGEYVEMPGLSLTAPQARRLWGLDPEVCEAALQALVDAGFLRVNRWGCYLRRDVA